MHFVLQMLPVCICRLCTCQLRRITQPFYLLGKDGSNAVSFPAQCPAVGRSARPLARSFLPPLSDFLPLLCLLLLPAKVCSSLQQALAAGCP